MKQILQNLKSGELMVEDVPAPSVRAGHLLIRTRRSLISAGTERMLVNFGRAGYLAKARQQPEKVRQVLEKVRTDGLVATAETVLAKLDQPIALGYCNVGEVIAVGEGVSGYAPGDRVVSGGRHAEVVCVPINLCARIPEDVSDDDAVFTIIASIGLQGIRLLKPDLGESIAVFGLGLIGLLSVQMLAASGVRVIGFDFDSARVALARKFGVEAVDLSDGTDPVTAAVAFSGGVRVDGVLVTAATKSDELMHQAAEMSRKRGRIILTGVTGLNLDRADFYEKELSFQVSCSYGPGRYDPTYEDDGHDYPLPFVRWTEQRNLTAVLELMRAGKLATGSLISERFSFADAGQAYDKLGDKTMIGMMLEYEVAEGDGAGDGTGSAPARTIAVNPPKPDKGAAGGTEAVVGVIGAGNFTQIRLLPALAKSGARLRWVASASGASSTHAAKKFAFENNTTDYKEILGDPETNAVFITTRHGSHSHFVIEALEAGKNVMVEKPLCIDEDDLDRIAAAHAAACEKHGKELILMVGFNRRFAALTGKLKQLTKGRQGPLAASYTCNAGAIPADHWVHDAAQGGGRIVGEAVHFIDYLHYLAASPIVAVSAAKAGVDGGADLEDNATITLTFADGSIGQVNYFSGGAKSYPKERVEVFFDGKVVALDNFRKLSGFGTGAFRRKSVMGQDKGHTAGFISFIDAIRAGSPSPIPLESILNVHHAAFAAMRSMRGEGAVLL